MVQALTSQETIQRARKELDSGRNACLNELLGLIESLSVNLDTVSLDQLTELIEKDPVILTRVLAVANKVSHNPGMTPIGTLSQALHQIGFVRVRNLAVSLMLIDRSGTAMSPEQREAATLTLTSGLLAKGAARFTSTHDPETVFTCATLRNIGRVLMATISPAHYREAEELNHREPQLDGFRRRFGLSIPELSRNLLTGFKLSEDMAKALRDGEPEAFRGTATTHASRLFGLCDFGQRLAALSMDTSEPDAGFARKVSLLSRRFDKLIPGAQDIATPALLYANENLRSFARCPGVGQLPEGNLSRLRHRLDVIAPGAAAEAEKAELLPIGQLYAKATMEASQAPAATPETAPEHTRFLLPENAVQDSPADALGTATGQTAGATSEDCDAPSGDWENQLLSSLAANVTGNAEGSANDTGLPGLEVARKLLEAGEAWLLVRGSSAASAYTLEQAKGNIGEQLPPDLAITSGERSVFSLCISRGEVVLVHDVGERSLTSYLPAWWQTHAAGVRSFALVPLKDAASHTHAILVLGWEKARRVQLSRHHLGLLHTLLAPAQGAVLAH